MSNKIDMREVVESAQNRRRFLTKLGIAGVAATTVMQLSGQEASASGITDVDILNFALNLEYLEAEFYTVATSGKYINQMGIGVDGPEGMQGPTNGGKRVSFYATPNYCRELAHEIAYDERTHVTLIRSALKAAGAPYVAKPGINLEALGFGFGDEREFFTLARIFEDIGVSAYGGAAPLISDKAILGTAARILAAEAEHSAAIRLQVARLVLESPKLDGADILPPPSGRKIVSVDRNGLTAVRTPGQVLYLAYGAANAMSGGFFPQGVNGAINTSSGPATMA